MKVVLINYLPLSKFDRDTGLSNGSTMADVQEKVNLVLYPKTSHNLNLIEICETLS